MWLGDGCSVESWVDMSAEKITRRFEIESSQSLFDETITYHQYLSPRTFGAREGLFTQYLILSTCNIRTVLRLGSWFLLQLPKYRPETQEDGSVAVVEEYPSYIS